MFHEPATNVIIRHTVGRAAATLTAAVVLMSLSARADPADQHPAKRPSVLLITIDTLRADHLGCYGYSRIQTPNLDRLAASGLRFENAYAQVPLTLPSHAVILTGTYPMFNGVRDFTTRGLPGDIPTLAEIFRQNGYRTAAFVSSFALSSMWGLDRGFEVYDDNVQAGSDTARNPFQLERRGDRTVDRALEWLGSKRSQPFLLWLHLYDPHSPYRPPEPYRTRYAGHPYDGEIAFDDAQAGRVMARLRALNVYDDTLIVLLSDHGESLGEHGEAEHGFFVYNATLRVPLIIKLPGDATPGRVVREPVGAIDVAPTVAQVCKIPSDQTKSFQGRSLLVSAGGLEQNAVYAESHYPQDSFGWHALRSLVTARFKYIEAPRSELYHLKTDPAERSNHIALDSATAAALGARLAEFGKRFEGPQASRTAASLDPETLEKLKSLGYISYQAAPPANPAGDGAADPKDKITTLNKILRAADLTRIGEYARADDLLARLERSEPSLFAVSFQRGENFLAWTKPDLALPEFRKTLSRNPTFDQAALGLGRAYFTLGQDAQAATAFQLALELNPRNFVAALALGKVYWRQNLLEKAEAELAPVVRDHPDFAEARADHGIILAKLKKYREALPEIEQGIELGYHDAIAYNYLGIAEAELGDREQAIRAYQKAVALDPSYAAAYVNLAFEFRRQGRNDKARAYFQKVCQLSNALCRQYAPEFSPPVSKK